MILRAWLSSSREASFAPFLAPSNSAGATASALAIALGVRSSSEAAATFFATCVRQSYFSKLRL